MKKSASFVVALFTLAFLVLVSFPWRQVVATRRHGASSRPSTTARPWPSRCCSARSTNGRRVSGIALGRTLGRSSTGPRCSSPTTCARVRSAGSASPAHRRSAEVEDTRPRRRRRACGSLRTASPRSTRRPVRRSPTRRLERTNPALHGVVLTEGRWFEVDVPSGALVVTAADGRIGSSPRARSPRRRPRRSATTTSRATPARARGGARAGHRRSPLDYTLQGNLLETRWVGLLTPEEAPRFQPRGRRRRSRANPPRRRRLWYADAEVRNGSRATPERRTSPRSPSRRSSYRAGPARRRLPARAPAAEPRRVRRPHRSPRRRRPVPALRVDARHDRLARGLAASLDRRPDPVRRYCSWSAPIATGEAPGRGRRPARDARPRPTRHAWDFLKAAALETTCTAS